MSYEEAPATALVATHCCVCGRPLLEAESLASGIGPICAEKTGYGRQGLPPEVRERVNKLVYQLAALGRSMQAVPLLTELRELGFGRIADRIELRLADVLNVEVRLELRPDGLLQLEIPFVAERAAFDALVADLREVPGRRVETVPGSSDGIRRVTTIPNKTASILALYRVLSRHLAGRLAKSPKGVFVIPNEVELDGVLAKKAPPKPIDIAAEQEVLRLEERHA